MKEEKGYFGAGDAWVSGGQDGRVSEWERQVFRSRLVWPQNEGSRDLPELVKHPTDA